ncbi:hypothetical protein GFL08_11100 [Glaesserella parasuis]|nr:hypothetical protein [Glaesserella parasuis]
MRFLNLFNRKHEKRKDAQYCMEMEISLQHELTLEENLKNLRTLLDNHYIKKGLMYYNHHRTHQGKMCCGRTPMETLLDGKRIWAEKYLSSN